MQQGCISQVRVRKFQPKRCKDLRGFSAVLTTPGLSATNVKPSERSAAANSATSMFSAALEIGYCGLLANPLTRTTSRSARPVEIEITFLVGPSRRRGRNAFVAFATPTTFVRNWGGCRGMGILAHE